MQATTNLPKHKIEGHRKVVPDIVLVISVVLSVKKNAWRGVCLIIVPQLAPLAKHYQGLLETQ